MNKSQGGNSSTVVDRVEWVQQEPWASVVPCREAGKRLALDQKFFCTYVRGLDSEDRAKGGLKIK